MRLTFPAFLVREALPEKADYAKFGAKIAGTEAGTRTLCSPPALKEPP
jgi:hypothetical protein